MRIAIIGCGTAGPAAALVCAKDGHEVTVFEKVPDPQPVGAGILLQPTGLAVLDYLGLREKIVDHAAVVNRLSGVTVGKRTVMDFAYHDLRKGLCGFGVHRGLLYSALCHALEANSKQPAFCASAIALESRRRQRWSRTAFSLDPKQMLSHHRRMNKIIEANYRACSRSSMVIEYAAI